VSFRARERGLGAEAPRARRKLAAILMVDVSGFSRMMGRDEEWTTRAIRAFHERAEARVQEHEGRVVDTAGDSVFAEFDSVVNATRCAQAIQEDQALSNESEPPEHRIETRIGVHVGDVIVEEYKVYGDGVNIAARLESIAQPGHILVSEAVYQQVRNKIPAEFRDEGMRELKNIEHPVRVYSLAPSALVAVAPPREDARREESRREEPRRGEGRRERRERLERRRRAFEERPRSLVQALLSPANVTPFAVGIGLLCTPSMGLNTLGVLPTAGAILLGLALGRARGLLQRRPRSAMLGLGIGIMFGAHFTHWSPVTDFLFILGGGVVAVQGLASRFRALPPG
jgi:class 3 adenylate cyclase